VPGDPIASSRIYLVLVGCWNLCLCIVGPGLDRREQLANIAIGHQDEPDIARVIEQEPSRRCVNVALRKGIFDSLEIKTGDPDNPMDSQRQFDQMGSLSI
jgi:hypothetical protein